MTFFNKFGRNLVSKCNHQNNKKWYELQNKFQTITNKLLNDELKESYIKWFYHYQKVLSIIENYIETYSRKIKKEKTLTNLNKVYLKLFFSYVLIFILSNFFIPNFITETILLSLLILCSLNLYFEYSFLKNDILVQEQTINLLNIQLSENLYYSWSSKILDFIELYEMLPNDHNIDELDEKISIFKSICIYQIQIECFYLIKEKKLIENESYFDMTPEVSDLLNEICDQINQILITISHK